MSVKMNLEAARAIECFAANRAAVLPRTVGLSVIRWRIFVSYVLRIVG